MDKLSGNDYFWVNNPDFRLFKHPDPNNPDWCDVSGPLIEWGHNLVERVAQDPQPLKVGYAKWKLGERYWRFYFKTTDRHRLDEQHATHPCLHRAFKEIWEKLDDLELHAAIPELMVQVPPLRVASAGDEQVIDAEPEPSVEEVSGIDIGVDEDEPGVQ